MEYLERHMKRNYRSLEMAVVNSVLMIPRLFLCIEAWVGGGEERRNL